MEENKKEKTDYKLHTEVEPTCAITKDKTFFFKLQRHTIYMQDIHYELT